MRSSFLIYFISFSFLHFCAFSMTTQRFWLITVLLVGGVVLVLLFLPGYSHYNELREKEQQLTSEINHLEQENARLRKEQALLERDISYLEETMRNRMGRVKPGEVVYKVVEGEEKTRGSNADLKR